MTPIHESPIILIVDDTPSNLSVVVNLFEDRGCRVAIAQDGEEGVRRAQLVQPDLILLDVMMPGIDGFEACRRLKDQPVTRDIPVIFMTALAMPEQKVKGFQAGAVDYVTKPLQIDEVMARVDTHLKLHTAQKRLEEQNLQLERHREELELRVAERTAELAAREREFRTLAESLPDNLVRYDKQCRIVYMNRNLELLLGKKTDTVRGMTPVESAPGSVFVEYQACLAETIATGKPREIELLLPGKGEGDRFHHIRFVGERDADGEIVGALAIGRDITERKQAERELILLNSAVNASSEAAFLMNAQGRFVYVNEEACRSLGYSRDELLGMSPPDIDPDITSESFGGLMDLLFSNGIVRTPMESHHRTRKGRIFPVEIAASPLKLEDGYYCLTMVRDISTRKQAERVLYEQEQAIRAVVENSPDAIARYDKQLRRIYVNPATQKLYGLPPEEIIGKTFEELSPTPESFEPILRSVFESGEELRIELPFRWANGEKGWGDVRVVPEFGANGQVVSVLSIGRDITERRRAEDLLREERGLFVGGPTVVFKWKAQEGWPVEYVSPNVHDQFGYAAYQFTDGEILFGAIVHPDDIDRVAAEVSAYTAQGRLSYEQEYRIAHADGSYRWIYDFTVVSRKADGTVDHYHGYVMDITDRKNAENALRVSEQRYRLVFENSPVSIWEEDFSAVKALFDDLRKTGITDIEAHFDRHPEVLRQCAELARIVNVNMAAVALHEAASKEELFAGLASTFTPESFDTFRRELAGLWNGQTGMKMDAVVKTLAGERRDVTVHFTVCPGHEDSLSRVLVSLVDITERKHAESALRESEQRYREIFDNAVEGMYLLEVTGDGRFRNIEINPALAAATGIPREAMIGKFVDETVPEYAAQLVIEKYRRCIATGTTISESIELDLPAGKRYFYSTVTPIVSGGRVRRLIGISRDITQLKQTERELSESRAQLRGLTARREEAREEERKYIAREVHDELGQILTGLKINVSVLDHKYAANAPQLREKLEETMQLTDKALDVARNVATALRPAALEMGIVSALEWLAERFGLNTGIQCTVNISDDQMELDENRAIALFRIVQESLTNIARYAKTDKVLVTLDKDADDYVLKVRDNGVGFDVKTAKTNSFGLVGIRERALMLGGTVEINSSPGNGTEIVVRIPARENSEES